MQSESAESMIMTDSERQALEMVAHDRFWCLLFHQEFGRRPARSWLSMSNPSDCICGTYQQQAKPKKEKKKHKSKSKHKRKHTSPEQETQIAKDPPPYNEVAEMVRTALADSSPVCWSNEVASLASTCIDLVLAQVDQALQPIMAQLLPPSEKKAFEKGSICEESEDAVEQLQEQVVANRKRRQELMLACEAVGRALIDQVERDQVGLHLLPVEVLESMVGRPVSTASRRFKNHKCAVAGGWHAMYHDKVVAQLLDDTMILSSGAYGSPSYVAWMATVHDRRLAHTLWGDDGKGLTDDIDPCDNKDKMEQLDEEDENLSKLMREIQDARVISAEGFLQVLAGDSLARSEVVEKILKQATDEKTPGDYVCVGVDRPTSFMEEFCEDHERKICYYVLRVMHEEGLQHMTWAAVGLLCQWKLYLVGVSPASGRLVGLHLACER